MAALTKVWNASFFERKHRGHSFVTQRVVAPSMAEAQELAADWASQRYGDRVVEIKIERSKGEVICAND